MDLLQDPPGFPRLAPALPQAAETPSSPWYNRCLRLRDAPEIEAGALRADLDRNSIQMDYQQRQPGITWIDDFLTPVALNALRRFCLESTVWSACRRFSASTG